MDPASLLEALAQAVRVGLVARDVFNAVRTLLDAGEPVTLDELGGFRGRGASGTWSPPPSSSSSRPDETTWSDAAQRPIRRRRPRRRRRPEECDDPDIRLALGTEAW